MGCYKNKISKYINYGLNFITPLKKLVQNKLFSVKTIKDRPWVRISWVLSFFTNLEFKKKTFWSS